MTITNQNEAPLNLDDINRAWSELLSNYVIAKLTLEKQNKQLEEQNKSLKAQLHQAQIDLLAAQGKAIINEKQ